jgi:hypothetical protein
MLAVVAATALVGALLTIDVRRLAAVTIAPPAGWLTGTLIGAGLVLVDLTAHLLGQTNLRAWAGLGVAFAAAALAGPVLDRARALRSSRSLARVAVSEELERCALLAGVLFAAAAWLVDRAAYVGLERPALLSLAGAALDPPARARVVAALLPSHEGIVRAELVDAVAAFLAFAPAVIVGLHRAKSLLAFSLAALVAAPLLVGAGASARLRRAEVDAAGDRAVSLITARGVRAAKVEQPSIVVSRPTLVVRASGEVELLPQGTGDREPGLRVVYADSEAPFGAVFRAVNVPSVRVVLAGAPELPDRATGELAPLVGPGLPGHDVVLARGRIAPVLGKETLTVVKLDGGRARASLTRFDSGFTVGLGRTEASLASDGDAKDGLGYLLRGQHHDLDLRYTPARYDSVADVLHDLDVLARLLPPDPSRRVAVSSVEMKEGGCDIF